MRITPLKSLLIASVAGFSLASFGASASVLFLVGNHPQNAEQNILLNGGAGTTVSGITDKSGTLVDFTSLTGETLIASSMGQAKITTMDNGGLLTSIDVSAPGHTFIDLIVDPQHSGPFTITAMATDGPFTANFDGGNGENFVTLVAHGGETISSVDITSSAGFSTFAQPRISGLSGVTVIPEPSTWVLVALGFGGLGYAASRRRRSRLGDAMA